MKKRRLKRWVVNAIQVSIAFAICFVALYFLALRLIECYFQEVSMYYHIEIETWKEDFELIDETETLEEAIEIAKKVDRRTYKAIMIYKVDYDGSILEEMEVEI